VLSLTSKRAWVAETESGRKEKTMKLRIILIVCAIAALVGFNVIGHTRALYPHDPNVMISSPLPDLHPKLAALTGIWEASLPGIPLSRVVVEKVNENWASVLYFWPNQRTDHPSVTWERIAARVLPDGELRWGYPVRFSLRANDGVGTLEVYKGSGKERVRWSLKKVEGPLGHNWAHELGG
jgi:hypothetical protein